MSLKTWLLAGLLLAPPAWADTTVTSKLMVPQSSTALEATHTVSTLPAVLYGASVTTGATSGFFMVLNLAADAGGGGAAVDPVWCAQVAANSTVFVPMDPNVKWNMTKGIVLAFSTTGCLTETTGSSTAFFTWRYEN